MLFLGGFLLVASAPLAGAQTATQIVRFRVISQSRAAVTPVSKPVAMRATSGTVSSSSLALATNESNLKVTASIDRGMPAGSTLSVAVSEPETGTSTGSRQLDTVATDVVTGIAATTGTEVPISYRVVGAASDASHAGEQRLVTYTILTGP